MFLRKSARTRRAVGARMRTADLNSGGLFGVLVAVSGLVLIVAVALLLGASLGSTLGLVFVYLGWSLFTAALRSWDVFMGAPVVQRATHPIGRGTREYVWMGVGLFVVLFGVLVMMHVVEI